MPVPEAGDGPPVLQNQFHGLLLDVVPHSEGADDETSVISRNPVYFLRGTVDSWIPNQSKVIGELLLGLGVILNHLDVLVSNYNTYSSLVVNN